MSMNEQFLHVDVKVKGYVPTYQGWIQGGGRGGGGGGGGPGPLLTQKINLYVNGAKFLCFKGKGRTVPCIRNALMLTAVATKSQL